jgi:hypothetical protein
MLRPYDAFEESWAIIRNQNVGRECDPAYLDGLPGRFYDSSEESFTLFVETPRCGVHSVGA